MLVSVLPGAGDSTACVGKLTKKDVDCPLTLIDVFRARVAVKVSFVVGENVVRFPKIASLPRRSRLLWCLPGS